MIRQSFVRRMALAALAVLTPAVSHAQWNLSNDFSTALNPNGDWSYGFRSLGNLSGPALSIYSLSGTNGGLAYWSSNTALTPGVFKNVLPAPTTSFGSVILTAGQLALHPGPNGEYSIVRWTAPTTGAYTLASQFIGADCCATTTDVHVLLDGASLFSGAVNGYLNSQTYGSTLSLTAGDVMEFVVGYGSNGAYQDDSTGLEATITAVTATPEPASVALLATGLLGIAGITRRKQRA